MQMRKISLYSDNKWSSRFTPVLLIAVSVVIIVWFLPRESGPQYSYEPGRPWMYSSLIAEFDFPIYKTDETIHAEQDSVMKSFQPYYTYIPSAESEQVMRFLNDFDGGMPGLPAKYANVVAERLRGVYTTGIMSTSEYYELAKDTTSAVRVVSGRTASTKLVSGILSERAAYAQLFPDDMPDEQRQALQKCDISKYIVPNLKYNEERSETEKTDLLSSIPIASGMVLTGQKIIDRGEIVDEHICRVLDSLQRELTRRNKPSSELSSTVAGQVLFVSSLVILLTLYLFLFRKDYFQKPRSIMMLYAFVTLFPVAVSVIAEHMLVSVYIVPFAIAPIFIRVFLDSRTAFISHAVMILICAAAAGNPYEFIIVELVAGLAAIYSLRELSQRAQLYTTALFVTIASSVIYFAMQLMQCNDIDDMDNSAYKYFLCNGVLLLFAYPLMLVVEKTFGFISNVTLIELSNTSKDLLRRLSEVAPGTFQHSIIVANLAAEVANKIGAREQLVRTGAMYHDIGKMYSPAFFTENQAGSNPLAKMSRADAAKIIIAHVTDGLKLAEKHGLPGVIKDFISTHHGTGKTMYFYVSYMNEHPGEKVDESLFRYPGPDPFTLEQAVLMMADSVEAASRSLPEYTEESISALVNRIIDVQMKEGFFLNCPITFHQIAVAKQILTERLKIIYHTRISYPEPH